MQQLMIEDYLETNGSGSVPIELYESLFIACFEQIRDAIARKHDEMAKSEDDAWERKTEAELQELRDSGLINVLGALGDPLCVVLNYEEHRQIAEAINANISDSNSTAAFLILAC